MFMQSGSLGINDQSVVESVFYLNDLWLQLVKANISRKARLPSVGGTVGQHFSIYTLLYVNILVHKQTIRNNIKHDVPQAVTCVFGGSCT